MSSSRVWNELQESDVPPPQSEMAKWEAEFNQLMNSERDDLDFTSQMEEQYKNLTREDVSLQTPIQFDDYGVPQLGEYVFGE
jgi:peroxin-5